LHKDRNLYRQYTHIRLENSQSKYSEQFGGILPDYMSQDYGQFIKEINVMSYSWKEGTLP